MSRFGTRVAVCCTVVALAVSAPAAAQISEDGSFQANTYTTGTQHVPVVATNASGEFVVVWSTSSQDQYGSTGISAQLFDATGGMVGAEFNPHTALGAHQRHPAVAMDDAGEFVIVWAEPYRAANTTIVAQRFASGGAKVGVEFLVSSDAGSTEGGFYPSVAKNPASGNFVVLWDATNHVRGRRFAADGTVIDATDFTVNTFTTGDPKYPMAAMNDDGSFVAVWGQSWPRDTGTFIDWANVWGRAYTPSGTPRTAPTLLNTTLQASQGVPLVGINGDGEFVTAWRSNHGPSGYTDVFARMWNADGTPRTGEFKVNFDTAVYGARESRSLGMDTNGNFVIAWEARRRQPDNSLWTDVNAKFYAPDGRSLTSDYFVTSGPSTESSSFAVMGGGQARILWQDTVNNADIFGKRFSLTDVVTVTVPRGGETWSPGTTQNIDFVHAQGGAAHFSIELSRDAGATWEPLALAFGADTVGDGEYFTASSGRFTWTVTTPLTLADNARVRITSTANAAVTDTSSPFTIDVLPVVSAANLTVSESAATATFTLTLAPASSEDVVVGFTTASGTAISGADFTAASGTVTFLPGQTLQTAAVPILQDSLDELSETFTLALSSQDAVPGGNGTATITDDDPAPSLTVDDVSLTEGNTGTVNAVFTVTLAPVSGRTVTVAYATANNTAIAGSDYTTTSGTLTFTAGQVSKVVTVPVSGDTINEANETFFVNLSGATGSTIGDGQGVGTIGNDDTGLPALYFSGGPLGDGDKTYTEGDTANTTAAFNVSLSVASASTVTVNFATGASGTATANVDYQSKTGSLTFSPGQTVKTFNIIQLPDTQEEIDEIYYVNLSAASGAVISDGQAVGTIQDNDPPPAGSPTVNVSDAAATEGNTGTVNAVFTITLTAPSSNTVTVPYATGTGGTATSGVDYAVKKGTLTFTPGQTSKTINVFVNGDTAVESNETFYFNLKSAAYAFLGDSQGLATITDNDAP